MVYAFIYTLDRINPPFLKDGEGSASSSVPGTPNVRRTNSVYISRNNKSSKKGNFLTHSKEFYRAPGGGPLPEKILSRIMRFQKKQKKV